MTTAAEGTQEAGAPAPDRLPPGGGRPDAGLAGLERRYAAASAEGLLRGVLVDRAVGRVALVSSFGADSAVLLHMVAGIDPATPVIFVDTGKLFAETLAYRDRLAAELGLGHVRTVSPAAASLAAGDPTGERHAYDPDGCCHLRKVVPLDDALDPFDAWITGRKRHQADSRAGLGRFEHDEAGRVKINPLADWQPADIAGYLRRHRLPLHPLTGRGYSSIGCAPCTTPTGAGEDPRAGRWRGRGKTECGIHLVGGRLVRSAVAPGERTDPTV